jgi:RNA polymerase sigma-70 factor, ECF subfamily
MSALVPRLGDARVGPQTTRLFTEHCRFVARALRRLGIAVPDVEDATQEVFVVVHRRLPGCEPLASVHGWLFAICRGVAANYHRGHLRAKKHRERYDTRPPFRSPEETLARREAQRFIASFLDTLDEPRRLVFYLADLEGLSAPEIATSLSVNPNTVYARLRAARHSFRSGVAAYRDNRWRQPRSTTNGSSIRQ